MSKGFKFIVVVVVVVVVVLVVVVVVVVDTVGQITFGQSLVNKEHFMYHNGYLHILMFPIMPPFIVSIFIKLKN